MNDAPTEPQMSEAEQAELRQLGLELAGASEWQPACVARAFSKRGTRSAERGMVEFTMQQWIDLEELRSPLLQGKLPELRTDVDRACLLFGLDVEERDAEEASLVAREIIAAIRAGFSMALKMVPPESGGDLGDEGMGDWLPLMACLVSQVGLSLAEAREIEVGQAYALIAGERFNRGWRVAGVPYALRGIAERGTRNAEQEAEGQSENCKLQTANLGEEGARG